MLNNKGISLVSAILGSLLAISLALWVAIFVELYRTDKVPESILTAVENILPNDRDSADTDGFSFTGMFTNTGESGDGESGDGESVGWWQRFRQFFGGGADDDG